MFSAPTKLLFQNYDIILNLYRYMDDKELINFVKSCWFIYQTIVERPSYWKQLYKLSFCLADPREQEWLTWFIWYAKNIAEKNEPLSNVNKRRKKHLLSSTTTTTDNDNNEYTSFINNLPLVPNFDTIKWFYAYYRRRQTYNNLVAGRFKKLECKLQVTKKALLKLVDVNPWNSLAWDEQNSRVWSIQHSIFRQEKERSNKLICCELNTFLPRSLFTSKPSIEFICGTNRFIVAYVQINTYINVSPAFIGDPIGE
ncbi:hypothetical protein BDF19DRAFT_413406 [Syncephalis fuscata]|nr:hypothetical protein BDF19DRAFT_413406 [Syncephalis fuscata]